MKKNINIYYTNKGTYVKSRNNISTYISNENQELVDIGELIKCLDEFKEINVAFNFNVDLYQSLYLLGRLEDKQYSVKLYDKYMLSIYKYIHDLWMENKREICNIDQNVNFLNIDLAGDHIFISIIKVVNKEDKIKINLISQETEILKISDKNIAHYLRQQEKTNREDAKHSINLEIKNIVEKYYKNNSCILKEIYIDYIFLYGEIIEFQFIREFIKGKFNLDDSKIKTFKENRTLNCLDIIEDVETSKMGMSLNKTEIQYFQNNIYLFYQSPNYFLNPNVLVSEYEILPIRKKKNIVILETLDSTIKYKLRIGKNLQKEIELNFPFIYRGDIIETKIEIDQAQTKLEYEFKHVESQYTISGNISIG